MFGNTYVWEYVFYDKASQIWKQMEWQAEHWTIVSDLLTLELIKEQ